MFGKNSVASGQEMRRLHSETVKVVSFFWTLQGEGPFSGRSAIFIRFAHCNLTCPFCDTYFEDGDVMSVTELVSRILALQNPVSEAWPVSSRRRPLIVLTGGEPLLQAGLPKLIEALRRVGLSEIQIESNGTVENNVSNTELIISPKRNHDGTKWAKPADSLLAQARALKFVVSASEPGYQDIPEFALLWREKNSAPWFHPDIYVSPMNVYLRPPEKTGNSLRARSEEERISFWTPGLLDQKENQRNHEFAASLALRYDAVLTLQTHLYANLP